AVTTHPGVELDRANIHRQRTTQVTAAQAIKVTNKVRDGLPKAVFNYSKAPFGFIHSCGSSGTDFVGGPDFLNQTVQATAQLVLLEGQQTTVLAIRQGIDDLVVFTDKGATGHFRWMSG